MSNSPLGQYAPLVASFTAVILVVAYIVALFMQGMLKIEPTAMESLQNLALLSVGAVFGSAVGVNGWKQSVTALHQRLDNIGVPPANVIITPAPQAPTDAETPSQ